MKVFFIITTAYKNIDIPEALCYIVYIESLCIQIGGVIMKINRGFIAGGTHLLLLTLLNKEDMYGYQIIGELANQTDNIFQFNEGTLYPVLHKLEKEGYLKSYKLKGENGRNRKYYQITKKGERQLVVEKEEWKVFFESMNRVVTYEFS